jgi:predicted ester cyclase
MSIALPATPRDATEMRSPMNLRSTGRHNVLPGMYMAAFRDLRMVPEDVIASGDKVVARVRATGTHKGAFMGLSPTGRRVEVQLMTSFTSAPTGVRASTGGSSTSSR